MAARSVHVIFDNRTKHNLLKQNDVLAHGEWKTRPPGVIGDRGEWESESDGVLTGTEGSTRYNIVDLDDNVLGSFDVHWDDPFSGSNSYSQSVTPAGDTSGAGFSIGHIGGGGENATVTFVLLKGSCQINADSGEIACAVFNPITTDDQRYAGIWLQDPGHTWEAHHGLTSDQYQQTFDDLVSRGYRLTRVSGYSVGGRDRYAAIWDKSDGPAFQARHGLTSDQYQQTFDELVGQGFRPTCVSGYSVGGDPRYAAIFEPASGVGFAARHGLTSDQYQQAFNDLVGQGFRLTYVSGFNVGGTDRYAAIWEQSAGPGFAARHGLTSDQYQQAFDELVGQGFRLTHVSGYSVNGEARYAAIWEQSAGPGFAARHGLTAAQYQQTFNELVSQGFRLVDVSGFALNG
jgi:Bacterial tandem repeat domain 1